MIKSGSKLVRDGFWKLCNMLFERSMYINSNVGPKGGERKVF